jgi:hypothetical protein
MHVDADIDVCLNAGRLNSGNELSLGFRKKASRSDISL